MQDARYGLGSVVVLGADEGVIVAGARVSEGWARFAADGGEVGVRVLKCASPQLPLEGAQVWLVERRPATTTRQYLVMVDDAYWGMRAGPSGWQSAPFDATVVMGYVLRGQVTRNGSGVAGAGIGLELRLRTDEGEQAVAWDSEEYNELVYSAQLDSWVEGPNVLSPITSDSTGVWEYIVPSGIGGMYRRQSDHLWGDWDGTGCGAETWLTETYALHSAKRVPVAEGVDAVICLDGCSLTISGTEGCYLLVGAMDGAGDAYQVPAGGEVTVAGLPEGDVTIAQFRRTEWGTWDSEWGCARRKCSVEPGAMTHVQMPAMEWYPVDGDVVAGRVYSSPGEPLSGLAVVAVDVETGSVVGTVATTDGGGLWTAQRPEAGFRGELFILDSHWASLPVVGFPYSDVVVGARAYAGWSDALRPEPWRRRSFGHHNFLDLAGFVTVRESVSGRSWDTERSGSCLWATIQALPKFRYQPDIASLIAEGPEVVLYDLVEGAEVVETGFSLSSQSFEDAETLAGTFRATGHSPEAKLLHGGKVHGDVVYGSDRLPEGEDREALRVGLEFGRSVPFVQVQVGAGATGMRSMAWTGLLCPYCGGPSWRDPAAGDADRWHCIQCADRFGDASAMDCATSFRSPSMPVPGPQACELRLCWWADGRERVRDVRFHWRPDVYDETDAYVVSQGAGQRTNAPRWFAKRLDQVGDGRAFGYYDGDQAVPFVAGHEMAYFSGLPTVARDLGVVQARLVFPSGYEAQRTYHLSAGLVRADGSLEDVRVDIPAGTRGPCASLPRGDTIRLTPVAKLLAEGLSAPFVGSGLCIGVHSVACLNEEGSSGCRLTIVADGPFLSSTGGVPVRRGMSTPVAVQLVSPGVPTPDLACDVFGQILLVVADEGQVRLHLRGGLEGEWDAGTVLPTVGGCDRPSVLKDRRGLATVAFQRDAASSGVMSAPDDWRGGEVGP